MLVLQNCGSTTLRGGCAFIVCGLMSWFYRIHPSEIFNYRGSQNGRLPTIKNRQIFVVNVCFLQVHISHHSLELNNIFWIATWYISIFPSGWPCTALFVHQGSDFDSYPFRFKIASPGYNIVYNLLVDICSTNPIVCPAASTSHGETRGGQKWVQQSKLSPSKVSPVSLVGLVNVNHMG